MRIEMEWYGIGGRGMSEATDLLGEELAGMNARLEALESIHNVPKPEPEPTPDPEPPHGPDPDPDPPHGSDPVPDPIPPDPTPPGGWPDNEPAGLVPVFPGHPTVPGVLLDGLDLNFDYTGQGGSDLGSGFNFGGKWDGTIIEKTTSPGSRYPNVIRKNMYIGDTSGWNGVATIEDFAADYETLYFRMIFKLSPNWQHEGSGDKLWYWGQANAGGSDFYIYLRNNAQQGMLGLVNQAGEGGDTGEWRGSTVVTKGEWHTVELIVRAQSALGVADGSFLMLLDGVEVTGFTWLGASPNPSQNAIEWYGPSSPTRLFSGLQFPLYWGGSGSTKTVNDYIDISEFYMTGAEPNG